MRRFPVTPTLILAVLAAATLSPAPVLAQSPQKSQILPLKPPPPPPIKPYTPVAAKPPVPYDDAAFVAFRKQLSDVAAKKDRAALAKLVVAQGFFWIQDKDLADPKKPGVDNLAKAIDLAAKDGSGWATLGGYGSEPTAAELPDQERRVLRAGRSDHRSSRPSKRSAMLRRPIRPNGAIRSRTASKCMPRRSRIRRSSKSSA